MIWKLKRIFTKWLMITFKKSMQVMVTDFDGESFTEKGHGEIEPLIGLWIQDYSEKGCTLMVNITKKEALFLAKSLLAIAESV